MSDWTERDYTSAFGLDGASSTQARSLLLGGDVSRKLQFVDALSCIARQHA